jgi:hypothetical protein
LEILKPIGIAEMKDYCAFVTGGTRPGQIGGMEHCVPLKPPLPINLHSQAICKITVHIHPKHREERKLLVLKILNVNSAPLHKIHLQLEKQQQTLLRQDQCQ